MPFLCLFAIFVAFRFCKRARFVLPIIKVIVYEHDRKEYEFRVTYLR